MSRLQFIRITSGIVDRIPNLDSINYVEYLPKDPERENIAEMLIYFIGSPVAGHLNLFGEDAEAFWFFLRTSSLNITGKYPKE